MNFFEALEALENGKYVTRTSLNGEGYFVAMPYMEYVWKMIIGEKPAAGTYTFSRKDFKATDWVEVSHKEDPKEPEVDLINAV